MDFLQPGTLRIGELEGLGDSLDVWGVNMGDAFTREPLVHDARADVEWVSEVGSPQLTIDEKVFQIFTKLRLPVLFHRCSLPGRSCP